MKTSGKRESNHQREITKTLRGEKCLREELKQRELKNRQARSLSIMWRSPHPQTLTEEQLLPAAAGVTSSATPGGRRETCVKDTAACSVPATPASAPSAIPVNSKNLALGRQQPENEIVFSS